MERPNINCVMMASIDGKIVGNFMTDEKLSYFNEQYGKIVDSYKADASIMGAYTIKEIYELGNFVATTNSEPKSPRNDFIANKDASQFVLVIDPMGNLDWKKENLLKGMEALKDNHIVIILKEEVSDEYLNQLQNIGISYIFGGEKDLDLNIVVKKLKDLFSINRLLVLGGGFLNGSFMNEGLIDELNLIVLPFVDGSAKSKTIFDINTNLKKFGTRKYKLENIEKLENEGIWLNYSVLLE